MKHYWDQLNKREQLMIALGSIFLLVYLIYILIFSPLITAVNRQASQLKEKQETLNWMQQLQLQPKHKKPLQITHTAKLLSLIDNQLNQNSFKQFPYQLKQTGTNDIQLLYDEVPFTPFTRWLWSLSNHYVFYIKQINIEQTETPGIVQLKLIISINSNTH